MAANMRRIPFIIIFAAVFARRFHFLKYKSAIGFVGELLSHLWAGGKTYSRVKGNIRLLHGSAARKYNDLGLKKYRQVEFDDAIADYTKAIELDPNLAVAYYNRGTVHYRLGNYGTALKDLVKSVDLEPKNPEFVEGLKDCQRICEELEL